MFYFKLFFLKNKIKLYNKIQRFKNYFTENYSKNLNRFNFIKVNAAKKHKVGCSSNSNNTANTDCSEV